MAGRFLYQRKKITQQGIDNHKQTTQTPCTEIKYQDIKQKPQFTFPFQTNPSINNRTNHCRYAKKKKTKHSPDSILCTIIFACRKYNKENKNNDTQKIRKHSDFCLFHFFTPMHHSTMTLRIHFSFYFLHTPRSTILLRLTQ